MRGNMTTIISWNVNGLRQRHEKNEFLSLFRHNPDIVCIQETKTPKEKIPAELKILHGYQVFCPTVPSGNFSETLLFTRNNPVSVRYGFGAPLSDLEGRIITADFGTFVLMNIYFPLGVGPVDSLENKLAFYDAFLSCTRQLSEKGRAVIICGDFSIAHTDYDVESVKKHAVRQIGTTPAEREKIDSLIRLGFSDAFRIFRQEKGHYTWWPNGFRISDRHLGRRLDYFFVNEGVQPSVISSEILSDIEGSDHCPVMLEFNP
jgi:exodeoxyribonuclease-3